MITKYHMPVDIHFGIGCLKDLATMLTAEDRVLLITDPGLIKVGVADRVLDVIKPTNATQTTAKNFRVLALKE